MFGSKKSFKAEYCRRMLERYGFCHVGKWTFDSAAKMIQRIACLGWKGVPNGVDPATYTP